MTNFGTRYFSLLAAICIGLGAVHAGAAQPAAAASATQAADGAQIRDLLKATWDKPGQPLQVEPVVTRGDHGIASWVQGERGGRALLQRRGGVWKVVACGGDGLKSAADLKQTGMPARTAEDLARALAGAEARLPRQTVAKFSLFDGIVRMDGAHGDDHK